VRCQVPADLPVEKHGEKHGAPVIVIPASISRGARHAKPQVRSFGPRGKGGRRVRRAV